MYMRDTTTITSIICNIYRVSHLQLHKYFNYDDAKIILCTLNGTIISALEYAVSVDEYTCMYVFVIF